MAAHISQHYENMPLPDIIIPIPLHRKRLVNRGFNQALALANAIKKNIDIPIDSRACQRIKATPPQIELSRKARRANLKKAFSLNNSVIKGKHVALIDDVVTTGATANELAHMIRKNGAKHIDVWCVARTKIK